MQRTWITLGSLAGLTAVAMAALAAHRLNALDPVALAMVRSAIEMQVWHSLALLACALWLPQGGKLASWAAMAFAIGILLFCGAVYLLAIGGVRLAMAAPVGGSLLMIGWLLLGLSGLFATRGRQ